MIRLSRICFVIVVLAFTSAVWGGALFPDVRGTTSANGKFLVVVEFGDLNPHQLIARVNYRVLRREEFINDKFTTANPFWSSDWNLSIARPQGWGIPLPFISDDGKYLVLVSVDAPFADLTVVRIYREYRYGGEDLLGTYKLKDIWSADELKAHANLGSTGRPLWFTGSTLGFSADNSAFVVRTPWGREVRLGLNDGAIRPQ